MDALQEPEDAARATHELQRRVIATSHALA